MFVFQNLSVAGLSLSDGVFQSYFITTASIFALLFIIYLLVNTVLRRSEKRSAGEFIPRLRKYLRKPAILLSAMLAIWIPLSFFDVPEVISIPAIRGLTIMLIIIIAWIAIRFVNLIKYFVLNQYNLEEKDNLKARMVYTQFKILERVLVFVIILLAVSISLMTFPAIRRLGVSILASAGVAGLIIGFAAQKVLGGILAGIQLGITQPIRIDDVVVVENEWGRIEEINLTYVVVKIWDQRRLVLPSSYFLDQPFQNWTRSNAEITGAAFIYCDYTIPIEDLRAEFSRLLNESDLWNRKLSALQVTNATEKTIEIRMTASAVDASTAFDLRVYLRENMIKYVQKNFPESLPKHRLSMDADKNDPAITPVP